MITILQQLLTHLTGDGGLLRVRGIIVQGTTAVVLFLFIRDSAVPSALLTAWIGMIGVYFGARFANGGGG